MTTTTEVNKADRESVPTLVRRGGPFTPAEFALLERADPVERAAMRWRIVTPTRSPEEIADTEAVDAQFGAQRAKADQNVAAEEDAYATANAERFRCLDQLAAVSSTTWISGGWAPGGYERAGTAGQIEAATAQLEDAELALKSAGQRLGDARVRRNSIGAAENELRRRLGAERALRKK